MKEYTKYRQELKNALTDALNIEGARLVKNRYRTLRIAISAKYPNLVNGTDKEVMLNFLKDAIYLDRQLRKLTEGQEEETKEILSQNFQIEELGMEVGLSDNVRNLKKL